MSRGPALTSTRAMVVAAALCGANLLAPSCVCVSIVDDDRRPDGGCATDDAATPIEALDSTVVADAVDSGPDTEAVEVEGEVAARARSCADCLACAGVSCCESKPIPSGTFMQGRATAGQENDVCSTWLPTTAFPDCDPNEQPEFKSTVSTFALDTFEVTVGRFRRFVEAYPGSQPAAGAGANPKIAGSGWDASWTSSLPADRATLIANVACDPFYATWTDAPGANENKPINCLDWYTAFAFCAWDGERLPTEAEWELAASGGEDRLMPWEPPPAEALPDVAHAIFDCLYDGAGTCTGVANIAAVGSVPLGAGRWGQHDLA